MKIGILGGDSRNYYLINEMLLENNDVYVYAMEKKGKIDKKATICQSLKEFMSLVDVIIGPIPFEKNGYINTPLSDEKILAEDVIKCLENKTLIGGAITKFASLNNIIDITRDEEFQEKNAVSTAEGVIQIALNKLEKNICGSKILVIGYGRCGKVIVSKFKALCANVSATFRKEEMVEILENEADAVQINRLENELEKGVYDIIVNTVPELIVDKNKLDKLNAETLIIDIASNPGGVDKKYAKGKGIEVIHALGIPGKKSPITSSKIIKEISVKILKMLDI